MGIPKRKKKMKNFVLVSNQFGFNMFVTSDKGAVDKIEDATHFVVGEDNPEIKLAYYKSVSGLDLTIQYL